MRFWKIIVVSLLMTLVYGCSNDKVDETDNLQESFTSIVPVSDINNSLKINIIYEEQVEYKFGSDVKVVIENVSDKKIFLPSDSSVLRAFVAKNNTWFEVENYAAYLGNGSILNPKGNIGTIWITGLRPVLEPSLGNNVLVRILATGEFVSNSEKTGVPVAAYVDLIMNP
ncbi:MAG: hypothetical protein HY865_26860 [Chloroflexi bacterium]|nr:hypothetical protein [Chloroflexota bacterium]